jgi:hypothetical protein
MKIIQSFWSCRQDNLLLFKAGWLAPEYNLMSWALSCLQLKKFHSEVSLYADSVSAKMLVDTLQLPYSSVSCSLDELNGYHHQLWALPKIFTYSKQESPFLHVDGDVYVWKRFDQRLLNGELIAQNEEAATLYYENVMRLLENHLDYFPTEIIEHRESKMPIHAYNAGIMGGSNIQFFREYTMEAFHFIKRNLSKLSKIEVTHFNVFFEQYLFYCFAKKLNIRVEVLIESVIGDNEYRGYGDFTEVPYNKTYLHLLGGYKKHSEVCDQMASRLRLDYPEYYYRIISLFRTRSVPLFKNYFWFESDLSEKNLLERHNSLRNLFCQNRLQIKLSRDKVSENINSIIFWSSMVKSVVQSELSEMRANGVLHSESVANDLAKFEDNLLTLNKEKLYNLSKAYLYARDLMSSAYPEYIFCNPATTYEKIIFTDELVTIIESQFNWADVRGDISSVRFLIKGMLDTSSEDQQKYTLVVPECDEAGYSLTSIDELDYLLLHSINEPKSIGDLLEQMKSAFDKDDLSSSVSEFEKLIFGRIKNGLVNKSIRTVFMQYDDSQK